MSDFKFKKKYEHVSILKPNLTKEELDDEIKKYRDFYKKENIEIKFFKNLGEKNLAYEVKGNKKGYYFEFDLIANNSEQINKLEIFCKQNNNIIKFITFATDRFEDNLKTLDKIRKHFQEGNYPYLQKGLAQEIIFQAQNMEEDGILNTANLNVENVEKMVNQILDNNMFWEQLNGTITNVIKENVPLNKENEEDEEM